MRTDDLPRDLADEVRAASAAVTRKSRALMLPEEGVALSWLMSGSVPAVPEASVFWCALNGGTAADLQRIADRLRASGTPLPDIGQKSRMGFELFHKFNALITEMRNWVPREAFLDPTSWCGAIALAEAIVAHRAARATSEEPIHG